MFSIHPFSKVLRAYLTLWRIKFHRGKLFFAQITLTKTLSAIRWNETWAFICMFIASLPLFVSNKTIRAIFFATLFIYRIKMSANSTLIIDNDFFLFLARLYTLLIMIWDSTLTIGKILIASLVYQIYRPSFRAFRNAILLPFRIFVLELRAGNLTYSVSFSLFNEFVFFAWMETLIPLSWYYIDAFIVSWNTLL